MLKRYKFIILLLIPCILLSGCYDSREVDDEVYAIAIGVDVGVGNMIRLTIQYPTYQESSGGGGSSGEKEKNKQEGSNVHTIEAPSILEGIDMYGMSISRKVSLMHAKMLVFSDELARKGIGKYLAASQRYKETRSSMQVLVVRGRAEDFIIENKSNIGGSISKATEVRFEQSIYSGYFPKASFHDLYEDMVGSYKQAIAVYAGINKIELEDGQGEEPPLNVEKGLLPGEIPRKGVSKLDFAGLAVFDGDKMVGYLDSYETTYYLMMIGVFPTGAVTIKDKADPNKAIVLDMRVSRKPVVKAYFKKGKPVIDVAIRLEADIESIQSRINYEKLGKIEELNRQIEDNLLDGMNKTVEKTQKEFKSDIFGYGRWFAPKFLTIQEWEKYNWLKHYEDAKINIDLDVNVRRTGIMINSSKIRNHDGVE